MPIVSTYRNAQIQPGVVFLHGLVIAGVADGIPDPAASITPGCVWTRNIAGQFVCTFRDGVAVANYHFSFMALRQGAMENVTATVLNTGSELKAGSSSFEITLRDDTGLAVDPVQGDGWSYLIVRANSTVVVR